MASPPGEHAPGVFLKGGGLEGHGSQTTHPRPVCQIYFPHPIRLNTLRGFAPFKKFSQKTKYAMLCEYKFIACVFEEEEEKSKTPSRNIRYKSKHPPYQLIL